MPDFLSVELMLQARERPEPELAPGTLITLRACCVRCSIEIAGQMWHVNGRPHCTGCTLREFD